MSFSFKAADMSRDGLADPTVVANSLFQSPNKFAGSIIVLPKRNPYGWQIVSFGQTTIWMDEPL